MPSKASNGELLVMTITKALVVLILVGTVAYCTISQIPISDTLQTVLIGVLGAKELVSAKVYYDQVRRNGRR